MKFLHLADLHLGKRLSGFSLIEDQHYILFKALDLCVQKKVGVIALCGDIYDTAVPTQAATSLLSDFLVEANKRLIKVLMIPGNHDSAERLGFAASLLHSEGVYIVSNLSEAIKPIELEDVDFYLFPFFKHFDVNHEFNQQCETYEEAARYLLSRIQLNPDKPSVLLAHHTVYPRTGELKRSRSEEIAIGTVGNIDALIFKDFTYVALGHIHKAQQVANNAFYSGAIYKYHSDEVDYEKNFFFVEVDKDGYRIEYEPIPFLHDVVVLTGTMEELLHHPYCEDYVFLVLKDQDVIMNSMDKARRVFPNCCAITYESKHYENIETELLKEEEEEKTPFEMLSLFYKWNQGEELSEYQKEVAKALLEEEEEE